MIRKRFKKRTIKCPYPDCDKLVANKSGLTQHIQASHAAIKRHPQRSPTPGATDHEQPPFDDDMQGPGDGGDRQRNGAFTFSHPLIDG
jgi:hypothetical protein